MLGKRDFNSRWFCVLPIAVGLLMSLFPHIQAWYTTGSPEWFADYDDLAVYLPIATQSYCEHPWQLNDAVSVQGGASIYPWLQFVPGIELTRLLGLPAWMIPIVWRSIAGITCGAAWFYLFSRFCTRRWLVALLASLMLTDSGLLSGLPFVKHASLAFQHLVEPSSPSSYLATLPMLCFQWRIITPGMSLPFLLLFITRVYDARNAQKWPSTVLAGISFGLLFWVYFYYWTAAGLALLLAIVMDRSHRKMYFSIGVLGVILGIPEIVRNAYLKTAMGEEWLHRIDKFLTIPRFEELLVHPSGLLIVLLLPWILLKRKDLVLIWSLAAAGWLLCNHHVITSLQIENNHWMYVRGPALSLLIVLLLCSNIESQKMRICTKWCLPILVALQFCTGLRLRSIEATDSSITKEIQQSLLLYRTQISKPDAPVFLVNKVIAGDRDFVNFAAATNSLRPLEHYLVIFSPSISNQEWDFRIALNAYLLGQDADTFRSLQNSFLCDSSQRNASFGGVWGPWKRSEAKQIERVNSRAYEFEKIAHDPQAALSKANVTYLATRNDVSPPSESGEWRILQNGETWSVWERSTPE